MENIRGNNNTLAATIALTEEETEKQLYREIWVEPLGPLREDAIFDYVSKELYNNCTTPAEKVREMARSAVAKNTLTHTAASNSLAKIGIKVSVSILCRDIQRPSDAPLSMRGPLLFFSEEVEVNISNAVVAIQLHKARVTHHNIMAMSNSMQKGTPTAEIFNN